MTAAVEILVPKQDAKLERAIGVAGAARFVSKPSSRAAEHMLVAWLTDLNDGRWRRELHSLVNAVLHHVGHVPMVLIEAKSAAPTSGEGLQALLHWTALLGREPYIASDPAVVRRMILARQSKAEQQLIASASIDDGKLIVWTCEPRRYEVPVEAIPALARLKPQALAGVQVSESGSRIHWDEGDVDFTAEAIRAFADPEVRQQQDVQRRAEAARYAGAIRALRERQGLRQADIKGLTERQVRRLEEGDTMPRAATLGKLAAAHGMDVDEYLAALAALSSVKGKKPRQLKSARSEKAKATSRSPRTRVRRLQLPKTS